MLQRTLPAGFIAPCLPSKTDKLPSGSQWLHEIKHDGFRIIARKKGAQVKLYSRPGNDLTHRFPLYAFDLIELNGDDLRPDPLAGRKATLEMMLAKAGPGIRFNEHMEGDGETVFRHACKLGLEGVVSKRKDSAYRSGRSPDWLKMKNANAPAVKREAEEDWGRVRRPLSGKKREVFRAHPRCP
jgi:bifunctional non-homologous end joining protein LigD